MTAPFIKLLLSRTHAQRSLRWLFCAAACLLISLFSAAGAMVFGTGWDAVAWVVYSLLAGGVSTVCCLTCSYFVGVRALPDETWVLWWVAPIRVTLLATIALVLAAVITRIGRSVELVRVPNDDEFLLSLWLIFVTLIVIQTWRWTRTKMRLPGNM